MNRIELDIRGGFTVEGNLQDNVRYPFPCKLKRRHTTGKRVIAVVKLSYFLIRPFWGGMGIYAYDMKTFHRMAMGVASTVLLSAGLSGAAQRVDPLTHSLGVSNLNDSGDEPAASGCSCMCTAPCLYQAKSS